MDLKNLLLQRVSPMQMPNPDPKLAPADKRFATAQAMQQAYQNNWEPNPILIRLLRGR